MSYSETPEKEKNLVDKLDISGPKTVTQQLFHKGMFLNRPRSNSLSETSTKCPRSTLNDEAPDKAKLPTQENETEWTQATYGKRQRSSPDSAKRSHKQTKLNYWLATPGIPTSNRFKGLDDIENRDMPEEPPAPKPPRPPPMFIDRVSNIQPLLKLLEEVAQGEHEVKVLRNERVKIQPKSAESYSTIYKELKKKNTEFYTHQPKQDRSFRVVLKHLHPSTDKDEIKAALEELDHKVRNIWNIQNRTTKQALPMWNVDLEPTENNKDIYKLQCLLNCRIVVEPPKPKREIPQCSNCQEYGHTQKFCHRQSRCVKCAGSHHTSQCSRKERSDSVKCILCDGNHPANYKGCIVYKELQKIKFPAPYPKRKRIIDRAHEEHHESRPNNTNTEKSYAAITKGNPLPPKHINTDNDKSNIDSELKSIKELLVTLMNQMLIMTKTFTEFMSRTSTHSLH